MMRHIAHRLKRIPPYVFSVVAEFKREAEKRGQDVIDLGIGSPDLLPPRKVIDKLKEAVEREDVHGYAVGGDIEREFNEAVAEWYEKRFGVKLDPETEVLPLLGSKEGLAHFSLGILNSDDIVIIPSPAYPVHFNGVVLAGGIVYNVPLREEDGFKFDIKKIDPEILRLSRMIVLNTPHNPTTTIMNLEQMEEIVNFLKNKDIIIVNDLTYSEIVFNKEDKVPSILQIPEAKKFTIEFHTLSKTYSMAGWRIGMAVGNRELIAVLKKIKSYTDFGNFRAIMIAATEALRNCDDYIDYAVGIYKRRRDVFIEGLNKAGWKVEPPKATFYVWAKIPLRYSTLTSIEFVQLLIDEAGVVASPGTGFGEYGEGFVRFALVRDESRLKEATHRITKLLARED